MNERLLFVWFLLVLFCMMVAPQPMKAESAASYCVIDSVTGRGTVRKKTAYTKRGMASTTKIMTALVALEPGKSRRYCHGQL